MYRAGIRNWGGWLESGLSGSASALAETWDSVSSTMAPSRLQFQETQRSPLVSEGTRHTHGALRAGRTLYTYKSIHLNFKN